MGIAQGLIPMSCWMYDALPGELPLMATLPYAIVHGTLRRLALTFLCDYENAAQSSRY